MATPTFRPDLGLMLLERGGPDQRLRLKRVVLGKSYQIEARLLTCTVNFSLDQIYAVSFDFDDDAIDQLMTVAFGPDDDSPKPLPPLALRSALVAEIAPESTKDLDIRGRLVIAARRGAGWPLHSRCWTSE